MSNGNKARNGDISFLLFGKNPHIEMEGNKAFSLDGSFSIVEYSGEEIKIKSAGSLISIFGTDLLITFITDTHLNISGKIISIEFS